MIRFIPQQTKDVFLSFDDGPDEFGTRMVLDVLDEREAKATFFVIGEKLRERESLVRDIVARGHALGNHSWDHRYRNYFASLSQMKNWITRTDEELTRLGLPRSVGFRPPAGVVTPRVREALQGLGQPLVLWNERFFDAVLPLSPRRVRASAQNLQGGSIVLLHDRQSRRRAPAFCATLREYIDRLYSRDLRCSALSRELCEFQEDFQ